MDAKRSKVTIKQTNKKNLEMAVLNVIVAFTEDF